MLLYSNYLNFFGALQMDDLVFVVRIHKLQKIKNWIPETVNFISKYAKNISPLKPFPF